MTDFTSFDQRYFRDVLGRFPTGVTVITSTDADEPVGMVVGSFTSASLDPPLVAFLPAKSSTTYPAIKDSGRFCVNILAAEQDTVCQAFFAKSPSRFDDARWSRSPVTGSPLIDEVVAWIDCEIDAIHDAGDHDIVVGRVVDMGVSSDRLPLVFFQGGYGRFSSLSLAAWAEAESLQQLRYVELARPEMEAVARELSRECLAIARDGNEMLMLASAGSLGEHRVPTRVGLRYPIAPPMGSLFFAFGGDAAEDEWISLSHLESDRDAELREVLQRVRTRGWSIGLASDAQQEFDRVVSSVSFDAPTAEQRSQLKKVARTIDIADSEPAVLDHKETHHIRSVSAPVFGPSGDVVFMLMAFGFRDVTIEELTRVRDRVITAARRVTEAIGGRSLPGATQW